MIPVPSFPQESGEFAEGLHARTLPLRVSALPTRRPAEGPDSDSALRAFRSFRPPLPTPPLLLLRCLLTRPYNRPQPASRHGSVSHPDVPAQPQHSCARLRPPDTGAYLPQPHPDTTAAVAVAAPSIFTFCAVPAEEAEGTRRGTASGTFWRLFLIPVFSHRRLQSQRSKAKCKSGDAASVEAPFFYCMLAELLLHFGHNRN